jgi:beta-mannosidase
VIDASGAPKAAWYYLRRALQPIAAHISDEGGNGLYLHVTNDRPVPFTAEVDVGCYRSGEVSVASVKQTVGLAPHQTGEFALAAWFDGFHDLSYAYRFGPPAQDLVVATVRVAGQMVAQAFHFPTGLPSTRELDVGLSADLDGDRLIIRSRRFAQSVAVDVEGFQPDDSYFHLPPGGERVLRLRRVAGTKEPRGTLQPLNAENGARLR